MPKVKTEERVTTIDYTPSEHLQHRQHVAQQPRSMVPSDPALTIAQASHEALLASGNVVYRAAIQQLSDLRTTITRYQSQNMELSIHHEAARDAYMRLYGQMKAHVCPYSENSSSAPSSGQAPNPNASRHALPPNPALCQVSQAPLSSLPPQVSASSQGSRDHAMLPQVLVSSSASIAQVSLPSQASPPECAPNLSRVSAASSHDPVHPHAPVSRALTPTQTSANPLVPAHDSTKPRDANHTKNDDRTPAGQPGGPSAINYCGPTSVSPTELHAARPSSELYWYRTDWLNRGCPSNLFIVDEHGKSLAYLIKDIRAAARAIWTDIAERRDSDIAPSFKRNNCKLKNEFVQRVEEMYPCLKLCHNNWKALQVGTSSYNYWYKRVWKGDSKRSI